MALIYQLAVEVTTCPVGGRPTTVLQPGESRSFAIEHIVWNWQGLLPGRFISSIRFPAGAQFTKAAPVEFELV